MSSSRSSFKVPIPSESIGSYTTGLDPYILTLAVTLYLRNYIYLIGRISNLSTIAEHLKI